MLRRLVRKAHNRFTRWYITTLMSRMYPNHDVVAVSDHSDAGSKRKKNRIVSDLMRLPCRCSNGSGTCFTQCADADRNARLQCFPSRHHSAATQLSFQHKTLAMIAGTLAQLLRVASHRNRARAPPSAHKHIALLRTCLRCRCASCKA